MIASSTALRTRPNNSATNKFTSNTTTSWGIYVQEKAEQIDRLQSNLAAALSSEKAHLQAIRHHWLPSFPAIEP